MKLRTKIVVKKSNIQIDHSHRLLFLGSCFAENMFQKCKQYGFHTLSNPLGIAYHPTAILHQIEILSGKKELNPDRFVQQKGLYFHLDAHSSLFGQTKEELINKIESAKEEFQKFISGKCIVFISLGTAFGYVNQYDQKIVSNCHKLPSSHFEKTISTVDDIQNTLIEIQNLIGTNIQVITTVSPIRHIKDGMVENQESKSKLRVAISQVTKAIEYFPSYEIMVDDLRDYRFYKDDLIHPNALAINYIWDVFRKTYFSDKTEEIGKKVEKVCRRKEHKHLHPNTLEAKSFDRKTSEIIKELQNQYPEIHIPE